MRSLRRWRRAGRALVTPLQSARRQLQHDDSMELLIRTVTFIAKRNEELERRLAFREFGVPDPERPALSLVRGDGPEAS